MCEKENSKFARNILNFLIERSQKVKIPKSPRKILPSNDSFFKFLILCHWLASQEEFIIKWQQVVRTFVNILKTRFKNATRLKSKSK
jgi:hypothetical protein